MQTLRKFLPPPFPRNGSVSCQTFLGRISIFPSSLSERKEIAQIAGLDCQIQAILKRKPVANYRFHGIEIIAWQAIETLQGKKNIQMFSFPKYAEFGEGWGVAQRLES
ncbi:MAG: hypothetical protein ACOYYU_08330 [Chloroflexota bacterium]